MGNWWLAPSLWQQIARASCLVQSFLAKHKITQVTQPPYSPDLLPCHFWLFPKLKSPLKGKRFLDHQWDSRKYDRAANGNWENCVRSQGAYFEGDWDGIVLCTVFLISCIFFNKCLYFPYYMAGYFWTDLIWHFGCRNMLYNIMFFNLYF